MRVNALFCNPVQKDYDSIISECDNMRLFESENLDYCEICVICGKRVGFPMEHLYYSVARKF